MAGLVTITMAHYHNVDAFYGCFVAKRKPWGKQQQQQQPWQPWQLNPYIARYPPPAGANAMANVAIVDNVVIDVFIVHFLLGTLLTRPRRGNTVNGLWLAHIKVWVCVCAGSSECVNLAEDDAH